MKDIQLTEEGKYSYTKQKDGERTIQFLKRYIPSLHTYSILDGTANIGGDTILFGLHFHTVHAIEIDSDNFKALQHNVGLYKFKNVHLHEGDTTKDFKEYPSDILYLDPPWGGPEYKDKKELDLWLGSHRVDVFLRDSILAPRETGAWKPQWIVLKGPFNYKWDRLDALEGIEAMHMLQIRNYRIVAMKVGEGTKKSKTRRAKRAHST